MDHSSESVRNDGSGLRMGTDQRRRGGESRAEREKEPGGEDGESAKDVERSVNPEGESRTTKGRLRFWEERVSERGATKTRVALEHSESGMAERAGS